MSMLQIRGAKENNLQCISLDIPLGDITVLTGPSGCGKSSLAVDTILAEGQRRLIAALGGTTPARLKRPDVDLIANLPPTIGVLQQNQPGSHVSFGHVTEVYSLLCSLLLTDGIPHCPHCHSPTPVHTVASITNTLMALPEQTRLRIQAPVTYQGPVSTLLDEIHRQGFARIVVDGQMERLDELNDGSVQEGASIAVVVDRLRPRPQTQDRIFEAIQTALAAGNGCVEVFTDPDTPPLRFADHPHCFHDGVRQPHLSMQRLSPQSAQGQCDRCCGEGCKACRHTGIHQQACWVFLAQHPLHHWLNAPISQLAAALHPFSPTASGRPILEDLQRRLSILMQLGLDDVPLRRRAVSLSTGELGRARLAGQTSHGLSGVLFVLDEPSTGLHPADIPSLIAHLQYLNKQGNTLLLVDHHPALLDIADHHIALGPGAGPEGGTICHQGPPRQVSPTAFPDCAPLSSIRDGIWLRGARGRNLNNLDLFVPRSKWTAVCGVSGSGKTALVIDTFTAALQCMLGQNAVPLPFDALEGAEDIERVLFLDRTALGRTWRSCTATAVNIWTPIRNLLASTKQARIRGFGPERFSFNRAGGRCEACQGAGRQRLQLPHLPFAVVMCEACNGRRFEQSTLSVEYKGASVADILQMSVQQAQAHFVHHPSLLDALSALNDVGLGYLHLGQTADAISGGEAQRIRLANLLSRGRRRDLSRTVIVMDEPTAALHPQDVAPISESLRRLVSRGATLLTATGSPTLLRAADCMSILGPGGGSQGGNIVNSGHPKV